MLLQQLQIGVDEAQLQCDRVLELTVGGRLEEVLGARPQPQLLVDLLVQFTSFALQFATTRCDAWIRALEKTDRKGGKVN